MMTIAKAISFFLGPIFILFPVPFILVSKINQNYYSALKWSVFSYAFVLAVAVFVLIGVMLGKFSNFDVSKREQRPLLFLFSAFIMSCYLLSLIVLSAPKILYVGFFALLLGLVTIVIVNRWVKASIHLATATSVVLFMGIVYGGYYFLLLLLIPVLAWARIKTKEHTFMETAIGTILGLVLTLIVYIISRQLFLG